ncbi:MAG: 1-deoxy-D-xylulose-5-phosphate synthase [Bacteroidia bacterium]|nr:1-deoxy-D-xylulose-5-phosphate synthase [Bacteroidia bacterium]
MERIMYIEYKEDGLVGDARIGRVKFSRTMKSIHYKGKTFQTLSGRGFKANYFDVESGEYYWISGCRKDGKDRLYGERLPIYIDEDVQKEYWLNIRKLPHLLGKLRIH